MQDETVTSSRELRRDSSRAERICWELLRSRRLNGVKFRRQHPIGPYFGDFVYVSKKLVVEIDGEHHAYQTERDARRTAALEREGWCVLRFWANEVVENPEGIWTAIEIAITERTVPPHPTSPQRRASEGAEGRGA